MSNYYSLRKKLLLYISLPLLLASIITLSIAFKSAWNEIEEVYDAQLVNYAKVISQLLEHELIEEESNDAFTILGGASSLQHQYEKNLALRVWHNNKLITQTVSAKEFKGFQAPPGFSDQYISDEKWRFFVFLETKNNIKVETSERYSIRYELIAAITAALIIPLIILIPLALFIVWKAINTNFKPIVSISSRMDKRSSNDLSPISYSRLPSEISPLIEAINRLLERISCTLKREKEFTDHAAHQLLTPLAAMKTQAQVMQKRVESLEHKKPENSEDLNYLLQSIDRSAHMVEQLLSLSRLQNNKFPFALFNLSDCLTEVIGGSSKVLEKKNIKLSINIEENVEVLGDSPSISIMITNLLENALKYTPINGFISINLSTNGILSIQDSGPGIAEENHKKVFERFFREKGVSENGSGLGLSIVKWIADAHQLRLSLKNNDSTAGLSVSIFFKTTER